MSRALKQTVWAPGWLNGGEVKDNKHRLYEELKQQNLTMDLQPDSPLDGLEICTQVGLSRTPVRDTFRRLAGE